MVSIIIPVYNTGRFLERCFKSVLLQTYKDWECIVVNDSSTDALTIKIMKKWRGMNPNFLFIDKATNEGVERARVTGLSYAKGDYFFFIDSDDWIEKDALEFLVNKAEEVDADIVTGRICKRFIGGYSRKDIISTDWMERVIHHEELMDKFYISFFGCNILPVSVCATLYRRKLIEDSNPILSGLSFGEDLVFNMRVFPFVNTYYAIDKIVYYYWNGIPSSSDKYLDSWLENTRKLYLIKLQALNEHNNEIALYCLKVELVNYLKSYVNGCLDYRESNRKDNIDLLNKELKEQIYKDLASLLNSHYKDKSIISMIVKGEAEEVFNLIEQRYKSLPINQRAKHKMGIIARLMLNRL